MIEEPTMDQKEHSLSTTKTTIIERCGKESADETLIVMLRIEAGTCACNLARAGAMLTKMLVGVGLEDRVYLPNRARAFRGMPLPR